MRSTCGRLTWPHDALQGTRPQLHVTADGDRRRAANHGACRALHCARGHHDAHRGTRGSAADVHMRTWPWAVGWGWGAST